MPDPTSWSILQILTVYMLYTLVSQLSLTFTTQAVL